MSSQPGRYTLAIPSGDAETSRLSLQHRIWLLEHHDALHSAPIPSTQPQHVLDLCCGTGIWSRDFASANPRSTVLGVDISPPEASPLNNLEFAFGDAEGTWDFAASRPPFTLIYGRMLCNSVRDWDHMFRQVAAHLAPGGFFQIDDIAHAFHAEDVAVTEAQSPMMRWWRVIFQAASINNGIDINAVWHHTGRIRDAGFRFHRAELVRWYFGGGRRPDERQNKMADMWVEDISALIPVLTQNAIDQGALKEVTSEEATALGKDAVRDINENGVERGYYTEFSINVAQKMIA